MLTVGPEAVVHLHAGTGLLLVLTGLGAGIINGVAGGGQLLTFPVLLALGYPARGANVTSTIGIWPGYLGGVAGFRTEVGERRHQLPLLAACGVGGALAGSFVLLSTPPSTFESIVPWLVLLAVGLFAVQPLVTQRFGERRGRLHRIGLVGGTTLAAAYGGYFGAGLGVILLAVLGLTLPDTIAHTSGLRTVLSVLVNGVAALVFVGAAAPFWAAAGLIAVGCFAGGFVGTHLLRRLPPTIFRVVVIGIGLTTALKLLLG